MSRNNKKTTKSSTDKPILTTIINSTVILVIVSLGFIGIFNYMQTKNDDKKQNELYNIWEEEFKKVENDKVGIQFDCMSTTTEQYNILKDSCNSFIDDEIGNADKYVSTDLIIGEQTYIDGTNNINSTDTTKRNNKNMVETGPIYFNNALMLRYINKDGNLKIVTSILTDSTTNEINVLEQDELSKYISDNLSTETKIIDQNDKVITEDEYKERISYCIQSLLQSKQADKANVLKQALSYFTVEGKNALIDCSNNINYENDIIITTECILAGKSDTSKNIKDRIYIEYKINNGGDVSYINIIVKLNSNLRVFDIDVI